MSKMSQRLANPPLSLYVHLPWCVRKCPYCDFNSHQAPSELPFERYIDALITDLEQDLPQVWGRPLHSIYFGGGTPSLFPARYFEAFLSAARARLNFRPDIEISIEANPGTVERDSFSAYAEAGINRVSLGVQSFDDAQLAALGRIHSRKDIERSLQSLESAGMQNFNIDLMYALPAQTLAQSASDIALAIAAEPAHVSLYHLTIEPNTAFAANPPHLPGDDLAWEMHQAGIELLESAGYAQYELSAFAKPGRQCRHNMNYWRYGDFLAVGAGAHGKVTAPATGNIVRYAKQRHPKRYLNAMKTGEWLADTRQLPAEERVFEFFLNQLRLKHGVMKSDFCSRTGLPWETVESRISEAIDRGLLYWQGSRLKPTELGWRFVNETQQIFLP
jgi:oxygen-independent coproporphyrinogen-3 oxidase